MLLAGSQQFEGAELAARHRRSGGWHAIFAATTLRREMYAASHKTLSIACNFRYMHFNIAYDRGRNVMRLAAIMILFTATVVAASAAAQNTQPPAATVRKVIAATKLPAVTNGPMNFKVLSITLSPGEKIDVSGTNSIIYQLSGSTGVTGLGEAKVLNAGDGTLITDGAMATLAAGGGAPASLLQFILSSAADLDRPAAAGSSSVRELYRTIKPIPDLKPGGYDLNLTQVTFPARMPSNPPHYRSGAALYYIVSGTGANTVDGKTEAKGPGSLIYEPYGLVHQWGNPGDQPLTFVAFNMNREGVPAVIPGTPAKTE
jgi:quercetin dioxygenase-like cupin family protein